MVLQAPDRPMHFLFEWCVVRRTIIYLIEWLLCSGDLLFTKRRADPCTSSLSGAWLGGPFSLCGDGRRVPSFVEGRVRSGIHL